MERVMSVEDKIRRAEEIYYRRRQQEVPERETVKVSIKNKRNIKIFKKMIKQIIVCLAIYTIFYIVINNNYVFSEDFSNKAREILNQDIDFSKIYSFILTQINENQSSTQPEEDEKEIENSSSEEMLQQEQIQNNEENIGGAVEELTPEVETIAIEPSTIEEQNVETLSQMEQDANYIKSTISFVKPVSGTISSIFGLRNPTTSTVPKNHTGTDIAAVTGTKIVSATDGTVTFSNKKGDFGKHLKIQINDVIIVYAHCNKLYVKEGDFVKQGQEIAEVGSTGNTTGPHLHFEVRYQDRYVDPQLILEL